MKDRDSKIELLRIIAMIMIVGAHYAQHGVIQTTEISKLDIWSQGGIVQKAFTELLTPGAQIGVALFFIIAGYFGIYKKQYTVVKVIIETIFYGLFTSALYMIFLKTGIVVARRDMLYSIFNSILIPISSGVYWFVTVYVLLQILSPSLNKFINVLNEKGQILVLSFLLVFEYIIPEFGGGEYFLIQRGVFFYFIGAIIRKRIDDINVKKIICIPAFVLSWGGIA